MARTLNNVVACEPFPTHGIQPKKQANGLVVGESFTTLTDLKAIADGPSDIVTGDLVSVSTKDNVQPWAKAIFETLGVRFILVPVSNIVMVKK